jgi:hypothetical protein
MSALALGLRLNAARGPRSLMARAISTLRRLGATLIGLPDDFGLVLGPELVTNGDFSGGTTGWATAGGATISASSGGVRVTSSGASWPVAGKTFPTVIGKTYRLYGNLLATSGVTYSALAVSGKLDLTNQGATAKEVGGTFVATAVEHTVQCGLNGATTSGAWAEWDNISVKEIISAQHYIDSTGTQPVTAVGVLVGKTNDRVGTNHATQATTASKPLVARVPRRTQGPVNLALQSNAFTTSPWTSSGTVTKDQTDRNGVPNGAWRLTNPGTGVAAVFGNTVVAPGVYTFAFWAKSNGGTQNYIGLWDRYGVGTLTVSRDFTAELSPTEFRLITITHTVAAGGSNLYYYLTRDRAIGTVDVIVQDAGLFAGAYTAEQIIANGGIPPTTTQAQSSMRLGPNIRASGQLIFTGSVSDGSYNTSTGVGQIFRTDVNNLSRVRFSGLTSGDVYCVTISNTSASEISLRTNDGALVLFQVAPGTTGVYECSVGTTFANLIVQANVNGTSPTFTLTEVRKVLEWSNALDFDGSNDLLTLGGSAILQQGSDHFVTAAFVLDAVGVVHTIYGTTSSAAVNPFVGVIRVNADGTIGADWRDDTGVQRVLLASTYVASAGVPVVVTVAKVGTARSMWVNGVLQATSTTTVGTTTPNTANIGALVRTTTSEYLNGKLIDIAIDQGTLTDNDRKVIERAMAQKAGVTLS